MKTLFFSLGFLFAVSCYGQYQKGSLLLEGRFQAPSFYLPESGPLNTGLGPGRIAFAPINNLFIGAEVASDPFRLRPLVRYYRSLSDAKQVQAFVELSFGSFGNSSSGEGFETDFFLAAGLEKQLISTVAASATFRVNANALGNNSIDLLLGLNTVLGNSEGQGNPAAFRQGGWLINPQIGFFQRVPASGTNPDRGYAYDANLHGGYFLHERILIEFRFRSQNQELTLTTDPILPNQTIATEHHQVEAGVRYFLNSTTALRPFLSGGFRWSRYIDGLKQVSGIPVASLQNDPTTYALAGVGTLWFLNQHLALDAGLLATSNIFEESQDPNIDGRLGLLVQF